MPPAVERDGQPIPAAELVRRGVDLLSQQIWCWGRDILRADGNWLLELGFQREEAPADRDNCSSVYSLELPERRRVILRGFGVFYGDDRLGGVFLPRFAFRPQYTTHTKLECPPWSDADLPELRAPDESQRDACLSLTLDLIDWVREYEATVAERLGADYRQATLDSWKTARGTIVPAVQVEQAWRSIAVAVADNPQALIPPS